LRLLKFSMEVEHFSLDLTHDYEEVRSHQFQTKIRIISGCRNKLETNCQTPDILIPNSTS
jgi:hypothetical protein